MRPLIAATLLAALTSLSGPAALAQSPADRLAEARRLEAAGQPGKAKDLYRSIWRGQPKSPEAPAALFALARLEEASGDHLAAYRNLERLVDKYPNSPDFNRALEGMFRIASRFLEGERLRLLGVPSVPSPGRAAEMFEKIVAVGPFSRVAPAAQFNAGLAYEKARRYPEAVAAYQRVSDNYPGSEFAADALYQSAYVQMLQVKAAPYDQTATKKALNTFQEFVITYPNHPKVPQALKNIAELEGRRGESALAAAEFYEAYGNLNAAMVSYQRIIDQSPGTEDARVAAQRLAALRERAAKEQSGERKGLPSLKLPSLRLPFTSRKETEKPELVTPLSAPAQPQPAPAAPRRKPAAPKPAETAPAPQQTAEESEAPELVTPLNFAEPAPEIRTDLDATVVPPPAPEPPAAPAGQPNP